MNLLGTGKRQGSGRGLEGDGVGIGSYFRGQPARREGTPGFSSCESRVEDRLIVREQGNDREGSLMRKVVDLHTNDIFCRGMHFHA